MGWGRPGWANAVYVRNFGMSSVHTRNLSGFPRKCVSHSQPIGCRRVERFVNIGWPQASFYIWVMADSLLAVRQAGVRPSLSPVMAQGNGRPVGAVDGGRVGTTWIAWSMRPRRDVRLNGPDIAPARVGGPGARHPQPRPAQWANSSFQRGTLLPGKGAPGPAIVEIWLHSGRC